MLSGSKLERKIWRTSIALALFFFPARSLLALDPDQPITQLYHSSWNAKNGLTGAVMALEQTTDGYLWVGTTDGLFRFDGLSFERYKPENAAFPSSAVSALMAVPDGGLWIGYQRTGATLLKNGQITNYTTQEGFPVSRVRCFARDHEGTIWAGVVGGFTRFDGSRWQKVRMDWNYPSKSAWTLFVDREGTLWATTGNGIMYLPKGEKKFRDTGISAGPVFAFTQAPDGSFLYFDDNKNSLFAFRAPNDSRTDPLLQIKIPASSLVFDQHHALWIAGAGIGRIPFPEQQRGKVVDESSPVVQRFTDKEGLTDIATEKVFEDREGNIWVATQGGLDRFRYRNLSWFKFPAGTGYFTLVPGDNGDVWTGTAADTEYTFAHVPDARKVEGGPVNVYVTYRDPDGTIWIGGRDDFARWTKDGFERIQPPAEMVKLTRSSATKDPITALAITKDRSGTLWVSFGGGGLFLLKNGSWTFKEVLKDHPDWAFTSALTDSKNRIWLAFNDLIACVHNDKVQTFSTAQGLTVGPFLTFAERDQHIWVGGESGLALLNGERFTQIKAANGSTFGSINGIIATANDGLWLSSSEGIVHIPEPDVEQLLQIPDYKVKYELMDLVSDLPEQLQRTAVHSTSAVQGSDGRLWFATRSGVALVEPGRIHRNPLPPPVVVRSLIADGNRYSTLAAVSLPPLTENLELNYTALSLSIPERVRFRYKLEGADREWQDAGTRRQAFYTNLGPGHYVFRVIACNNDGIWNTEGATIAFSVAPAWYQTTWFKVVVMMFAVFVTWVIYRLRVEQVAGSIRSRFDERLAERTRLARELHDTFLQTIQGSKMIADDALDSNPDLPRMRHTMGQLSAWLGQATQEGRAALNSLRTSTLERDGLARALRHSTEVEVLPSSMAVAFYVTGEAKEIHPIVRDEVYRIGHEAIHNSLVHSKASRLEVELKYAQDLSVRVKDNGIGIDPAVLEKGKEGHFGITGMKERAARIGGKLIMVSSPSGTEITVVVPSEIALRTVRTTRFERFVSLFKGVGRQIGPD